MLADLPVEILDLVIDQIVSYRDLKRLCVVSTRLHTIAIPHLYRSLILSAPELSLEDLAARLEKVPRKYLKYTKELGFSIPIHKNLGCRCIHHDGNWRLLNEAVEDQPLEFLANDDLLGFESMEDGNPDDVTDNDCEPDALSNLACALASLRFPDDQLRSFRWDVGTCIPEGLFCGIGSLLGNQKKLRSIMLNTDSGCGSGGNALGVVNLVQFRELRSLDWRGLNRFHDFESVSDCIKAHGDQIKSLTLDLSIWHFAVEIWTDGFLQQTPKPTRTPDNFFSQAVLNIHPTDKKIIFPSLEHLHLSAVSFYDTGMAMAHALNAENLKSLKLRNCPGLLEWLRTILNSGKPMQLKYLDLALESDCLDGDEVRHITKTVCSFIDHFSSLEDLYLMLPEPTDWDSLTLTLWMSRHHNLRRFVMHNLVDRGGRGLIDGDILWRYHLQHTLKKIPLDCFGCSISPVEFAIHLQRIQPRPLWKLIHVRTSGVVLDMIINSQQPDEDSVLLFSYKFGQYSIPYQPRAIYDFAQWAFGADGLPELQVLAWGDFSYEGRYSKLNLLFCKSDTGYCTLTHSDAMFWDVVQNHKEMLAACPFDNLMQ